MDPLLIPHSFADFSSSSRHLKKYHTPEIERCQICSRFFLTQEEFSAHRIDLSGCHRRGTQRGGAQRALWFALYAVLYPQALPPSNPCKAYRNFGAFATLICSRLSASRPTHMFRSFSRKCSGGFPASCRAAELYHRICGQATTGDAGALSQSSQHLDSPAPGPSDTELRCPAASIRESAIYEPWVFPYARWIHVIQNIERTSCTCSGLVMDHDDAPRQKSFIHTGSSCWLFRSRRTGSGSSYVISEGFERTFP